MVRIAGGEACDLKEQLEQQHKTVEKNHNGEQELPGRSKKSTTIHRPISRTSPGVPTWQWKLNRLPRYLFMIKNIARAWSSINKIIAPQPLLPALPTILGIPWGPTKFRTVERKSITIRVG
jgi:hypothetical protein